MKLTGVITASSLKEMQKNVAKAACQYFGTECVKITIKDAEVITKNAGTMMERIEFYAPWEAFEHHIYSEGRYGFPKCAACGTEKH